MPESAAVSEVILFRLPGTCQKDSLAAHTHATSRSVSHNMGTCGIAAKGSSSITYSFARQSERRLLRGWWISGFRRELRTSTPDKEQHAAVFSSGMPCSNCFGLRMLQKPKTSRPGEPNSGNAGRRQAQQALRSASSFGRQIPQAAQCRFRHGFTGLNPCLIWFSMSLRTRS